MALCTTYKNSFVFFQKINFTLCDDKVSAEGDIESNRIIFFNNCFLKKIILIFKLNGFFLEHNFLNLKKWQNLFFARGSAIT